MTNQRLLIAVLVVLVLLATGGVWVYGHQLPPRKTAMKTTSSTVGTVTVYIKGHRRELATTSPLSLKVQRLSESLFTNSFNALYEGISTDIIDGIHSGTAVEILYSTPILLTLHNPAVSRSSLSIDHLLIPLDGLHIGWILYGLGGYSSGPFTTDAQNLTILRDLISKEK